MSQTGSQESGKVHEAAYKKLKKITPFIIYFLLKLKPLSSYRQLVKSSHKFRRGVQRAEINIIQLVGEVLATPM